MGILPKSILSADIEVFCDRGIVFSLCISILVLPVSIALLDSFVALAIFLYLIKKIVCARNDWPCIWKVFSPSVNPLHGPLQFLALAFFVSVMFSQYPGLSLFAFIGKFLKYIFLYFSFIEAFRSERRVRIFLNFFFVSACIVALDGVIQYYTGKDFLKGNLLTSGRVNACFYTANGFGVYLLPVIGLAVHSLYTAIASACGMASRKNWVLGGVLALFLALLLTCLCWTYSRSSWVGYLVTLFVMAVMDWRKVFLAMALLLVFIFIFLPSLNHVRHLYLINDNSSGWSIQQEKGTQPVLKDAGSGRYAYWKKAISIIRSSPIYGTGLNTYSRIIMRNANPETWWYAHNCYLQMAAETGLLGLACFLWMVFVLLRHGLNSCAHMQDAWPLTFLQGSLSGLFGFLVQSFFDNTFYTVQLGTLMWLIFGLIIALTRLKISYE